MAFGFDPGIILSGLPRPPPESSLNDTLQTLASLASHRTQQQQGQAQLADMLRRQGQEKTLADIYRRNAGALPEGLPRELAAGGFGPQAYAAQDQAVETGGKEAQRAKLKQEAEAAYRKQIAEHFYDTKDEADYTGRRQELLSSPDMMLRTWAERFAPPEYNSAYVKRLGESAVSPEKRATLAAEGDRTSSRVITGEDGQQYLVNANQPGAAATAIRDAQGNPIKGRPPIAPMVLVQGEGGQQYWGDPRKPDAPVKTVKDEGGQPVLKPVPSEDKLAERNVGGYTFNKKNPPTADGAKKMANVVIARDNALGALDRLEKLFDEHGTQLYGPIASQMESEWKQITDQIRIQSEMGVPNGGDYPMLAKQIPNPVGVEGAKQLKSSIKAKFGVLRKQLAQTVDATAKAYKYSKEPSKVRVSNGKETREVDAADLAAAEEDGYKRLEL